MSDAVTAADGDVVEGDDGAVVGSVGGMPTAAVAAAGEVDLGDAAVAQGNQTENGVLLRQPCKP